MEESVQGDVTIMGVMTVLMIVIGRVMATATRYAYSYNQNDQTIIVHNLCHQLYLM
jgi:hypothetical protein